MNELNIINPILGIPADDLQKLVTVLGDENIVSKVILYGSRAKGNYRDGSDIDLTVTGKNLSTAWLMDTAMKIDDLLLPYKVDLSILDHIDNVDLIDHIERVGKVIFSYE